MRRNKVGIDKFKQLDLKADDKSLLTNLVTQKINLMIQDGELSEGDLLPSERELSQQLGISRSVVRESIKLLKASGVLRVKPGIGSFVSKSPVNILEIPLNYLVETDEKLIKDLQEARRIIEPVIARLAAQEATPDNINALKSCFEEMGRNIDNPDLFIQADYAYHIALAKASNNSVFVLALTSIMDLLHKYMGLAIHSPGITDRSIANHEKILNLIIQKDSEGACLAMQDHINLVINFVDAYADDRSNYRLIMNRRR